MSNRTAFRGDIPSDFWTAATSSALDIKSLYKLFPSFQASMDIRPRRADSGVSRGKAIKRARGFLARPY